VDIVDSNSRLDVYVLESGLLRCGMHVCEDAAALALLLWRQIGDVTHKTQQCSCHGRMME
jgi:hypothetical protein